MTAVTMIGLQIALTLAIVCNFTSIIQQRLVFMHRPTGIDEPNIFVIQNRWLGDPKTIKPRIESDLAAIRAIPGVIDAYETNGVPLFGQGRSGPIYIGAKDWQKKNGQAGSADDYFADQHGLATLNVKLLRGRWLLPGDIQDLDNRDLVIPANVVITQHLANSLFPGQNPLGRLIYHPGLYNPPNRVVGVVERMQTDWATRSDVETSLADDSIFIPYRFVAKEVLYVVRTNPGALAEAIRAAPNRLVSVSKDRIIEIVRTFPEIRTDAYKSLRWSIVPLTVICVLLLIVTAGGIIGLNMYWVSQRRRYIGMRRALGARRADILRYILIENLAISGGACGAGALIGLALNIWLASVAEVTRMSVGFGSAAALVVVALCQLAVLWPALRASIIPPATASRGL